ncbi:S9 family peptidase [Ramlibacter ginsenosidimutans]|uniref:S9 family peptidase n=1 Tax=Ramlibacter ginsenosidimutans TaxID=502333 RepID=A0A934TUJ5_9BURK|nr:prolyl oligopeptidase family serine peptidase [Ramlibacter ginsenosidimutans]MBK6007012.1 S9 family peptidase [Ramlibacter ginsenosidimutans]
MRLHRILPPLALAATFLLAGCATPARHPALAAAQAQGTLAPLVPVRRFVANVDFAGGFQLSPDGEWLVWSQAVGTDTGLAVRRVAGGDTRTFATGYLARPAGPSYLWLADNRHIAYIKDLRGDENTQIQVIDTRGAFEPWQVTPWPGVRSTIVGYGAPGSSRFFLASNRRDRATMDLYEADVTTRSVREIARSDGQVLEWILGEDRQLAGRIRQLGATDGSGHAFEVPDGTGGWRTLRTAGPWDSYWIHRIEPDKHKAWGVSNLGRDKLAVIEVDTVTGGETMRASDADVDIARVYYTRFASGPVGYAVVPGFPQIRYLDAALGADVQRAAERARATGALDDAPRALQPQSSSEDGRRWILHARGDFDDAELLLDRSTGEVTRLDPKEPLRRAALSPEEPYSFRASDGRTIHGYVIRPRGVQGAVPLVVDIHGGPWVRDEWRTAGFNGDQLLANRGYAVLTVNYRGSAGYGREHLAAGRMQSWDKVQADIAEAAQWAVGQGLADPQRMAVLGASYGGYSVLMQLIQKRQDWKCGVDLVGVANWVRVMENWPPFWRNRHYFIAFYGDPAKPEERARMMREAPVSHLDEITAPLLVIQGANDIRVQRQDSDEVVAGLRQRGRPVEYLLFDNEGHQTRRWRNRLEMWRRVEDTLATCLGGRSAGWDFYQVMPR